MTAVPADYDFKAHAAHDLVFACGGAAFVVDSHLAADLAEIRLDAAGKVEGRFIGVLMFVALDPDRARPGLLRREAFLEARGSARARR